MGSMNLDYYTMNGFALELLAQSNYHKQHKLGDYFRTEILPAIWNGQVRFYITEEGVPTAMVTWAWLSEEVKNKVHQTGRPLTHDEWKCGENVFINDLISPYDNSRSVINDIKNNVFADHKATSLRRNMDGSVRRINRWTGKNIRRKEEEAVA